MRTFNDFLIKENSHQDDIASATRITSTHLSDGIHKRKLATYTHEYDKCANLPPILKITEDSDEQESPVTGKFLLNWQLPENKDDGCFVCLVNGRLSCTDGPAFVDYSPSSRVQKNYYLDDYRIFEYREVLENIVYSYGLKWLLTQTQSKNADAAKLFKTLLADYKEDILAEILKNMIFYSEGLKGNFAITKIIIQKALLSDKLNKLNNQDIAIKELLTPEIEYDILSKHPHLAGKMHQYDSNLVDNIKKLDKKYNLDLAEEIEARIS